MEIKNILKKVSAAATLCIILGLPIFAYATSYTSSFEFDSTVTGSTRSYTGQNITLATTSSSSGSTVASSSDFSVALYRKNTITSTYISTKSFKRNGSSSGTWSGVGNGKYYFYFSKGIDGHNVKGTASMYN